MSRVLLVSPGFHGYWRSIAGALERRGHDVVPHVYDALGSRRAKVEHKLRRELPERLGIGDREHHLHDATERAVGALRDARPEVVVVVKGDVLGDTFWEALDTAKVARVTWLYDEVRRMRHSPERLAAIGPLASYSALDTAALGEQGLSVRYVPVAFDPTAVATAPARRTDEVVFIGARYGRREADLLTLKAAGVPVRAVGRDWSHHPVDRLRTWSWSRPDLEATRDVPLAQAFAEQAAAAAALNVHAEQDGFTMRTYEIPGVGGLQLIDRPDVASMYEPDREVVVYTNDDELVAGATRAREDRAWSDAIREAGRKRTLAEHTFDHRVAVLEELWG